MELVLRHELGNDNAKTHPTNLSDTHVHTIVFSVGHFITKQSKAL